MEKPAEATKRAKPRASTRPKRDPERTRAKILEAATDEFTKHGLGGARVDRIAKRASTNERMLYYYFVSKDALFLTVLENVYINMLAEAESALEFPRPPRPGRGGQGAGRIHLELLRRAPGIHQPDQQREPARSQASQKVAQARATGLASAGQHTRDPAARPGSRGVPRRHRSGGGLHHPGRAQLLLPVEPLLPFHRAGARPDVAGSQGNALKACHRGSAQLPAQAEDLEGDQHTGLLAGAKPR